MAAEAAPMAPLPPVAEIAKERIAENNLALWQSKNKSYEFFVGGLLEAKYSPGDKTLTVSNDDKGENTLTCKYDSENNLWVKVTDGSNISDPESACDQLVGELASRLQE